MDVEELAAVKVTRMTDRRPVMWLNYPRDVSGDLGAVKGPNTLGELWTIAEVQVWPDGTSRAGLSVTVPEDLERAIRGEILTTTVDWTTRGMFVRDCSDCRRILEERVLAPWHVASERCQSGGRAHCDCEVCF